MTTQTTTVTQSNAPTWNDGKSANEELVETALKVHTMPLWTQMAKLNPPEPNPTAIPHIWRYDEVRPSLLRAGEIITEQQAERRVLMLVNPARGMYLICGAKTGLTLFQMRRLLLTHYTPDCNW